ncbi:hypothetical protein D1641_11010 [Colidextribacter sp. OB.20]|nr:hypothetical protein [Colidextribacter sp. OB.20]
MLDKNEIITVALTPDYVYTEGKDQDVVWKDLGRTLCNESTDSDKGYAWSAYVNGELVYSTDGKVENAYYGYGDKANYVPKNVDDTYVMTGKGAQTEIYVDDGDATVTVVEINYYIGEVTRVSDDTITVKSLSLEPARLNIRTAKAAGYDVEDLVVFTVDENEDDDFYICEVFEPDTATGTIKRVESNTDSEDSYVRFEVGGDKYSYSGNNHIVYDLDNLNVKEHPTLEEEYTLYRDPNGYVLAFELAEDETLNYLYVKDSDEEMMDWVAKVIYADATTAKVDVKESLKGTPNQYNNFYDLDKNGKGDDVGAPYDKVHWMAGAGYQKNVHTSIDGMVWKYSKNTSGAHTLSWADGVYLADKTVTGVATDPEIDIYNGRAYIGDGRRVIVDQKTVFIDVENEKSYTGYDAVPNVKDAELIYVLDRKGVADVVFILDGAIYDDGFYFTLEGSARESWLRGGKGGDRYWHYTKSYVDGVKEDVYVDYTNAGGDKDELVPGVLYKATRIEEDGDISYIEKVEVVADFRDVEDTEAYSALADENKQNMRVSYARKNGYSFSLVDANSHKELQYTTNADTRFVLVEETYKRDGVTHDGWTVSVGSINDIEVIDYDEKLNTYVTVAQEDGKEVAEVVYILKTNTRYPVEITAGGTTKTYWAEMTKWEDGRRPEATLDVYDADLIGVTIIDQKITGAIGTLTLTNGRLTGDITINENVNDELKIEVETTDPGDKPATDKVAIKANEGVTYTVNGEPSTATSVDVKDGETVTVVATLKDGYKWADAAITDKTWTSAAAKGGETITIPATEKIPVTFDLSLTPAYTGAKVYVNNVETLADETQMTADGDTRIWKIAEGAKVIVQLPDTATVNDVATVINGVNVSFVSATKRAELTMTGDVTLSKIPGTADRVWNVVVEDGVTVTWMNGATDVSDKVVEVGENTYQVPESAGVNGIKVKSANTSGAIVTDDKDCMLASAAASWTVAKGAANDGTINLSSLDKAKTIYVYAASKIELKDSLQALDIMGMTALGEETTVWARPGVTLNVYTPDAPAAGGTDRRKGDGIIVQYGADDVKAGFNPHNGEFKVTEEDITLRQGWKVTLNGVTATVKSTGETIESGMRVANNENIQVKIAEENGKKVGTTVVKNMTGNYVTGSVTTQAVDTDVQVTARVSYTAATKVSVAANKAVTVKITESNGMLGTLVATNGTTNTSETDFYVLPGEVIEVDAGAQTLEVTDGTDPVTDGVNLAGGTARITIKTTDLTLTYS